MTQRFCIYDDDNDIVKIINITGDSEEQIRLKLLNYIIKNFNISVNEILKDIYNNSDIYCKEVANDEYYE